MIIEKLTLQNFRNYSHADVIFFPGINILQGENAQGKTNLLEAIFFCSIGKSLRVVREKEIIKFSEEFAKIKLNIKKKFKKTDISLYFSKNSKKSIKINNISIKKISELMGEFNAVYFSPDELKMIKEKPEDRRRFMDIHISQTSKQYFYLLNRYEKILANRNKLLKSLTDKKNIKETIEIWDIQLSEVGSKIILFRKQFLKNLTPYAEKVHNYLTSNKEYLILEYAGQSENNFEEIKKKFLTTLKKNFEKDFKLGYTSFGPHRDDIKVSINNIDIRTYGSQGQQRTVALSLKLAELEIMFQETGDMPILILDDVLSELDEKRRERLLKFCVKAQTFISGTDFPDIKNAHFFKVENGTIFFKR